MKPTNIGFKNLNPVIPGVSDKDFPIGSNVDADRLVQFANFKPQSAKLVQIITLGVEDHHPLFPSISHINVVVLIDSDAARSPKPSTVPAISKLAHILRNCPSGLKT